MIRFWARRYKYYVWPHWFQELFMMRVFLRPRKRYFDQKQRSVHRREVLNRKRSWHFGRILFRNSRQFSVYMRKPEKNCIKKCIPNTVSARSAPPSRVLLYVYYSILHAFRVGGTLPIEKKRRAGRDHQLYQVHDMTWRRVLCCLYLYIIVN